MYPYNMSHIFCTLFVLMINISPVIALVNYENNPDLTKAMEYDLEMNHADLKKYNRQEAERYYLSYLKQAKDDFQVARVYCQLGAMYAVAYDAQSGEKADFEKARKYYKKVIETEPERIGRSTIVARNMLASMLPCDLNRVKSRTKFHRWLNGITEETIKEKALPRRPIPADANEIGPDQFRIYYENTIKLDRLISDLKEGAIYNACCDSKSLDVPEEGLIYILENLPEDAPEKKVVQEFIKKEQEKVINSGLRYVLDSFIADDINDNIKQAPKEITVKRKFIPTIEFAIAEDLPFVFDISKGDFANFRPENEKTEEVLNNLKFEEGDLAWNGEFLASHDCILQTPKKEDQRALQTTKKDNYVVYNIPERVKLPYSFLARTQQNPYLITIYKITQEGIWIYYRQLSNDENNNYL